MKYLLSLIFVLSVGIVAVSAQSPPRPPKPLIYKVPEKNELKEFVSEDKTFQIVFPGVPKMTEQEIPNGKITNYRVYQEGSTSIVNTIDYNYELSDADKIYEIVKANLLKLPKAKIETEKDIKVGEISGKEFDVLQDYQFQKIRILIVGKRIYEIKSDVTNWHILNNYYKDKVAGFRNETERFFASFKSLKVPENLSVIAPTDFLGVADETNYTNNFFNFSFDFPKDWHRLNDTEVDASRNAGLEMLKTEKEKINKAFESAAHKEVVIFALTQEKDETLLGANLIIGVLKQPGSQITSEMIAVATKNFFLTNSNFKISKDVQEIKLNGTKLSTFTLENAANNQKINQKILVVTRKGYSISLVLSYRNEESLKSLERILDSLKFDTK